MSAALVNGIMTWFVTIKWKPDGAVLTWSSIMKRIVLPGNYALIFMIAGVLASGPAIADKPPWAGGGKGERSEHREERANQKSERNNDEDRRRDRSSAPVRPSEYFADRHRTIVHDYYGEQFRTGRCPPGLAKKNNGCMPPGQAKKWVVGKPLPRDVVYYEVPHALVVQIGTPPPGYRYVRVATDILLIAAGTRMVVDGIRDLGRM